MVKTFSYDPNGAISRAREFLKVGKKINAVQILHSFLVLMVKRGRPWEQNHEKVMTLYLDICVDLRDAPQAKDGIHQYRSISQQTAPQSLRAVVQHLINVSQEKLDAAKAECAKQIADNAVSRVERFGAVNTILSQVSLDTDEDRLKRLIVQPWVIFLWESYRSSLELLRNNQALHAQYHTLAVAAYDFCVDNSCQHEFKRLCEIVRRHYQNIVDDNAKPEAQLALWEKKIKVHGVRIDSNFIERQLLTRFSQMEHSASLELWTEVWRTIQDIHDIIASTPRELKPKIRAEFYLKASRVFLQSGNPLFHAYALSKHYALSKAFNRGITPEQLAEIASALLLATISVNVTNLNIVYGAENVEQKNRAIALQLNFDADPSRDALLADILQMGVLEDVTPQVRALYVCLEEDFAPLQLVDRFTKAMSAVAADRDGTFGKIVSLDSYRRDLEVLAVVRLLEHLASVYDKFTIDNFAALISKTSVSFAEVETIVARQCSQAAAAGGASGSLNVQIDHRNGTLNFHTGGPEGERIHAQLATLSVRLQAVVEDIEPPEFRTARQNIRANFFNSIREAAPAENDGMQGRQDVIEARKVQMEKRRYIEEQQKQADEVAAKKRKEEEIAKSMEEQQRRREETRAKLKDLEAQRKAVKAYAVQQLGTTEAKALVENLGKNLSMEEVDEAMQEVHEKKMKEELSNQKKKRALHRHLDYSTRALREAEVPIIEEHYTKLAQANLQRVKDQITKDYAAKRKRWEELREKKGQIIHLRDDVAAFHETLMESRRTAMAEKRRSDNRLKRAKNRMRQAIEEQGRRRLMRAQAKEAAQEEARRAAEREALEAEERARAEAAAADEARLEAERAAEAKAANRYVPPSLAARRGVGGAGFGGDRGSGGFGDRGSGGFGDRPRGGFGDRAGSPPAEGRSDGGRWR
eukprot:INCI4951.1.p1 GENE.INCI4951.1~~INCI4951.1.p1  ORF type:complete len:924 (+),score=232.76 INCI4951.1:99-2870(+)